MLQHHVCLFIRGPSGVFSPKYKWVDNLVTLSLYCILYNNGIGYVSPTCIWVRQGVVGGLWGVVGVVIGDIMGVRGLLIWKDDTTSSMWRRVEYILTFFVI